MKFRIRKCHAHSIHRDGIDRNHRTWYEVDEKTLFGWKPVRHAVWFSQYSYDWETYAFTSKKQAEAYIEKRLLEPISGHRECEVIGEFGDKR